MSEFLDVCGWFIRTGRFEAFRKIRRLEKTIFLRVFIVGKVVELCGWELVKGNFLFLLFFILYQKVVAKHNRKTYKGKESGNQSYEKTFSNRQRK